jgi:hypothetical protein
MSTPHTLGNSLRAHDIAIMTWLTGLRVDYGNCGGLFTSQKDNVPIISIFATPDRAFAEVREQLLKQSWIEQSVYDQLGTEATIPMPAVTVWRGDPIQDPTLAGVPKALRDDQQAADGSTKVYQFPGHYRTDYFAEFWCIRRYTDDFIREWHLSQFGTLGCGMDERLIPVVHPNPFGTINQSLKLTSMSDMSENEGTEAGYKRVQCMYSLRTWLIRPETTRPWG